MSVVKENIKTYYEEFISKLEDEFKDKYVIFDKILTEEIIEHNAYSFDRKKRLKDKVFKIKSFNIEADYVVTITLNSGNFIYRIPMSIILDEGVFFDDRDAALLAYECYE